MILYRPVGTKELQLIAESGFKCFPPRLPEQPIFYPVLSQEYATEIASNWNVKYNDDHMGYVTQFEVDDEFALTMNLTRFLQTLYFAFQKKPKNKFLNYDLKRKKAQNKAQLSFTSIIDPTPSRFTVHFKFLPIVRIFVPSLFS